MLSIFVSWDYKTESDAMLRYVYSSISGLYDNRFNNLLKLFARRLQNKLELYPFIAKAFIS
jgi:hypothetical protein